jgi:SRSO17 transposase
MERRYKVRLKELLDDAVVPGEQLHGMLARLEQFVQPFAACLVRKRQRELAQQYVAGLVSQVERKNVESIAYHHDTDRQMLQKFIGQYSWDHQGLTEELVRQVSTELGCPEGVLVIDPSAFPKKGNESVGVQRQWCGRLGKVDNCQVGVFLAYAAPKEHALLDMRLYLPKGWARSKKRRAKAGVSPEVKFQTRHELALQMLDEHAAKLPHGWVAGGRRNGENTAISRPVAGARRVLPAGRPLEHADPRPGSHAAAVLWPWPPTEVALRARGSVDEVAPQERLDHGGCARW